jgi:hypothetical protein
MNDTVNDAYTQTADWLVGTAKRNPEALLVLGAGLALLMRSRSKSASATPAAPIYPSYPTEGTAERSPGWTEGLSRVADGVSGYAADVKNRVTDATAAATTAATEYAGNFGRTISTGTSRLADQAHSAVQSGAGRILEAQPLAVAVFGAAAGAALAAFIPSTDLESRTMGSTREAIVDAANKVGENLIGAAGEAGERLKQGVVERGISSDGIKELAHDVADTFASKVSGAANNDPHQG